MILSKSAQLVVYAYEKGYRVNDNGEVISPRSQVIKSYTYKHHRDKDYYIKKFSLTCPFRNIKSHVADHKLCAYQKFGMAMFAPGILVRHLNGVSTDNTPDNIEIGTASDNMFDIPEEKRIFRSIKGARTKRKFSYEEVAMIRQRYQGGETARSLCKEFSVSKSTMSYLLNGRTYSKYE